MYEPGTLLADKYRIDRVLGRGGMGMVVAATHVQLNQPVALKFLLDDMLDSSQLVERFLREARASARLRGEHVCKVSDVGTLETGAPYMVMELLDGRDLASLLATYGPMPVATVVDYVLQACLGVGEAHASGIIHRDLKPANLFLTHRPDGSPLIKVLDFGIAKAGNELDIRLTRTTSLLGSPGYMSPEQLRSTRDADERSDIWGLGVIMYELVSGRMPFIAETITELAVRVTIDPTPQLPSPFGGFANVVYRCLEKEPGDRYRDVAQLAEALAPFRERRDADAAAAVARVLQMSAAGVAMRDTSPDPPRRVSPVATTLSESIGMTRAPERKKRGKALAAAVVAIGVVAGGAAVLVIHGGSRAPGATEPPASVPAAAAIAPAAAPPVASAVAPPVATPDAAIAPAKAASPPDAALAASAGSGSAAIKPTHHPVPGPKRPANAKEEYGESRY